MRFSATVVVLVLLAPRRAAALPEENPVLIGSHADSFALAKISGALYSLIVRHYGSIWRLTPTAPLPTLTWGWPALGLLVLAIGAGSAGTRHRG